MGVVENTLTPLTLTPLTPLTPLPVPTMQLKGCSTALFPPKKRRMNGVIAAS